MVIKAIISDYDGVIVNTLPITLEIYDQLKNDFDLKIKKVPSGDFFHCDWKESLKKVGITKEKDLKRAEQVYIGYLHKYRGKIQLFPKIRSVLEYCSKLYKIGLVSNNRSEVIIKELKRFKLDHLITTIVDRNHSAIKPNPDQIIHCMERLNVKPNETVYIGDMDGDVQAAINAGVKCIAVSYGFHSEKMLKGADFIVSRPEDIITTIKKIENKNG